MVNKLPFAALRISEGEGPQLVEVLIDGEPVALLPATGVSYEMDVHGVSMVEVALHARRVELIGGHT